MSNRGEMCVHGNSVIVQYPGGEGASLFTPGHRMLNVGNPERRGETIPWRSYDCRLIVGGVALIARLVTE
jgi:hypothetical protein